MKILILCLLVLAACTDAPQPAMHLRPVEKVTIEMDLSRVVPHPLMPMPR